MAAANDLRKGQAIRYNSDIYIVLEVTHRTPGNLRAFVQAIIRSIKTGKSSDVRFSSTEKVELVEVNRETLEFSYKDRTSITSWTRRPMKTRCISEALIGAGKDYLTENLEVTVLYAEGKAVEIEMPSFGDAEGDAIRRRRARRQREQRAKTRDAGNRQNRAGAALHQRRREGQNIHGQRRVHGPGVSLPPQAVVPR